MLYYAIVFLPLLGFLIAGLFGNQIGAKASEYITSGFMVIVALLSWIVFFQIPLGPEAETVRIPVLHWVTSGSLSFDWALRIDTLTGVMLVSVSMRNAQSNESVPEVTQCRTGIRTVSASGPSGIWKNTIHDRSATMTMKPEVMYSLALAPI